MGNVNRELRCARNFPACRPGLYLLLSSTCTRRHAFLPFCVDFGMHNLMRRQVKPAFRRDLSGLPLGEYKHVRSFTHLQLPSARRRRMKTFLSVSAFAPFSFTHLRNPASGRQGEAEPTARLSAVRACGSHPPAGFPV